jgi:flavin-dependent dehydrogenase
MDKYDVIIIGAGPAGSCAAAILNKANLSVCIIEKNIFPRFCIGESLLPQNMVYLEEAGLLDVFGKGKFQYKNGAQFLLGDEFKEINFEQKFTDGPFETYQVTRSEYDKDITDELESRGIDIRFNHELNNIEFESDIMPVKASVLNLDSKTKSNIGANFIIDASGHAKVLPKLIDLKTSFTAVDRTSYFTHIKSTEPLGFDNNKILITVDETNRKNWFWTIPLGDNKYSLGLISSDIFTDSSPEQIIEQVINKNPKFKEVLTDYNYTKEVSVIKGYTSKTETTHGERFVLIGNSSEFLDPIFSSGMTVALKSASLSSNLIIKKLAGENVDWDESFTKELNFGLNTFSNFVSSWYEEELQEIIFAKINDKKITSMIVSILAGYAWDSKNSYTKNTKRRLKALREVIADSERPS